MDLPVPHKFKRLWTCPEHMLTVSRETRHNRGCPELDNAASRIRYNKRKLDGDAGQIMSKRASTSARDQTPAHKKKCAATRQTDEEKLKAKKYEEDEIRKRQAAFRERMAHTFSQRKNWKYANTAMLRQYYKTHHAKYRERRNLAARQYRVGNRVLKLQQIKCACRRASRPFQIPDELALKLFDMPCFYCGEAPATASKCQLNGIDRVDNDVGYVEANVVPCCPTCNYMKKGLPVNRFVAQCKAITAHFGSTQRGDEVTPTDQLKDQSLMAARSNAQMIATMHSQMHDITSLMNHHVGKMVAAKNDALLEEGGFQDIPTESTGGPFSAASPEELNELMDEIRQELQSVYELCKQRKRAAYMVQYKNKIQWHLTVDEAVALTVHGVCAYCGLYAKSSITLDRLDSQQGYTMENVVPACLYCNVMKHDLTVDDFLDKVALVAQRFDQSDVALQMQQHKRNAGLAVGTPLKREHEKKPPKLVPTRKAIVVDTAIVDLHTIRTMGVLQVYHAKCHGAGAHEFLLASLDDVKAVYPAARPCGKCVTTQEDHAEVPKQLIPQFTVELAERLYPGIGRASVDMLTRLQTESVEGVREATRQRKEKSRRVLDAGRALVVDVAIVDLHTIRTTGVIQVYHAKCHEGGTHEFVLARVGDVRTVFPAVRPCGKCVAHQTAEPPAPQFTVELAERVCPGIGWVSVDTLTRMQKESVESVREASRQRKEKSRNTAVAKYRPGERVLLFNSPTARTYHTHMHRIRGLEQELDPKCWFAAPVARVGKCHACKVCCDDDATQSCDIPAECSVLDG
jgi:bacterioferritin-associated ferredoxin